MKYSILILALLFISCGDNIRERTCYACTQEQNREIASFVKSSIKDANNMSDEEMEDVIDELTITGIKLMCQQRTVMYDDYNGVVQNRDTTYNYHFQIY
jgi:hypothetical protein